MELTSEQLSDLKDYITQNKTVMNWMDDNDLSRDDIPPRDIVTALREEYGTDEVNTLLRTMRDARFGSQVMHVVSRMLTRTHMSVAMCDSLIAKLEDCLVSAQAKKAELEQQ